MSRFIDADELNIKLADELSDALGETDFTDGLQHGLKIAISLAEETPLADVKPIRHGHWIPYEYGDYHWHKCSVCGVADKYIETVHRDGYPDKDVECIRHYCPNCGAKMDEER